MAIARSRHFRHWGLSVLALVAAAPGVFAPAAFAQDLSEEALAQDLSDDGLVPGDPSAVFLGTLQLGESKREIQTDTAVPLTTIDEEEIEDRQANTVAELIDTVPGVTLVNGSTPQGSGINIRGYGANSVFGTDNKVLVQIDGANTQAEEIYRVGNQLFTDPALYKQVTVLRGTVGSFEYGSGVIGGVVLMDTKDASDFTGGEIGWRLNQTLQASSNGPGFVSSSIVAWQPTENLEFLFNYTYRRQGDQTDGMGDRIADSAFTLPSYVLKGKYTFGQNRDQSLTFVYNDSTSAERDVPYDSFSVEDFGNVDRDVHTKMTGLRYQYGAFGNDLVNVDVNLTYSEQTIDSSYVEGSYPGDPYWITDLLNADQRYRTTRLVAKNTSYFTTGGISHELRAGIDISQRQRDDAYSAPGGTDKRVAIFAVDEIRMGNFTLTPAFRWEHQDLKGTSYVADGETLPYDGSYTNTAPMGGISARYAFDNGFAIFASAAYTESMPPIDDLNNEVYATMPERSRTWEAGFSFSRMDLFSDGDALRFKVNAYKSLLWDVTTYTSSTRYSLDKVATEGVEIEASYAHGSGFYTDVNANIANGTETDARGTETPWRGEPPHSAQVTVGKRFDKTWDVSWEMVANGSVDDRNDVHTPGFGVNNFRVTYKPQDGLLEGTEVRLGVENIFDKAYQTALSTRMSPGRTVKLTVSKLF
ncbi:TonB-dependent receptor plug domain-containing protein [Chachezhania sediminis]|uniref:TonB-dependent receptor plug domain-containing protein n=1 Tax=Chachezhania sediminis TaxID=2599291 RepID=UPI0018EF21B9|nr:TonB-dependent receptor plug domain-containing protein [Chachezhania sediminis]